MPTWPTTLPQRLLVSGLSSKPQSGKLRTSMDQGAAKQRTRYTATVKSFPNGSVEMTGAQLSTFIQFYEDDLGQGALSFTWVNPRTDVSASIRFSDDYEWNLIRSSDDPDRRLYIVKLPLEIIP